MPGEDYFGNFMKGVDGLIKARNHIGLASDNSALSQAEREAQVAMRNLHMYFGRLSFWLTEMSNEAHRRLAAGETPAIIDPVDKVLVIDSDGVQEGEVENSAIVSEPTQDQPESEELVTEKVPASKRKSPRKKPKSAKKGE